AAEKADEAKKIGIEKDTNEQVTKEHVMEKQAEEEEHGDGQQDNEQAGFLNENLDMTVNDALKDLVEHEVQSMMDVPVTQAKPIE
nr:hypothetical protein [Tanacetum cinerariifolium]